ncbi:unnamed protein product [Rotaria socialis]|uniref:Uncharacterized protein n=2 Tax=Rotaria socialis TaxID=392032 RepID=A0A818A190_9BILA|nr:unnamed protein product [Rotaria socialis]
MKFPQKSIWSSDISSKMDYHQSSSVQRENSTDNNQWNNNLTTNENRLVNNICTAKSTCIKYFIVGSLFGGIVLAIIITLWLTSSPNTTVSTTITTTSSTSSTSATTPLPPCSPSYVGSASTLLTIPTSNKTTYGCYAYEWTPPTTGPVNFTFELRNDPGQWYLDDTSIYQGGTQMLSNIGFETGTLSPWVRTGPNGNCGRFRAGIYNSSCRSGNYCATDGSNGCADQLSQQFTATAGQVYVVSFWLKSDSIGSVITAVVTLL